MPNRLIRDVIKNQAVLSMAPTTTVIAAAREMKKRKVGAVMVVEDARLTGIFTERDGLFRVLAEGLNPDTTALSAVMTANPTTITPDRKLSHALHIMNDGGFRHMPVTEGGIPVGMVSIRDALGSELSNFEREVAAKSDLSEILG
ncbi:inosine-5-monophosphate dehydrogenase [Paramagnetospirillum kuznetsovii]|uniref:Inosine-5-monophosphate dehydrogenase n=1 Tax=Paramagnetospirillum kuznetsovii TaxID=2053833 RepID=A0A364NYB4_9PROT|nr:CBS domain-containing protein [Paramagnetospirillum kuznetsovii]RAU22062.1 inosine-5-monophosphate dehydrogenase [Paramagnetospirillum kuznetsovii]